MSNVISLWASRNKKAKAASTNKLEDAMNKWGSFGGSKALERKKKRNEIDLGTDQPDLSTELVGPDQGNFLDGDGRRRD